MYTYMYELQVSSCVHDARKECGIATATHRLCMSRSQVYMLSYVCYKDYNGSGLSNFVFFLLDPLLCCVCNTEPTRSLQKSGY